MPTVFFPSQANEEIDYGQKRRDAMGLVFSPQTDRLLQALPQQLPPIAQQLVSQPSAPAQTYARDMAPSGALQKFTQDWEKSSGTVYRNDGANTPTIGWGHQVKPGESFSGGLNDETTNRMFQQDLAERAKLVQSNVKVPLTQAQFDALADLAFNAPSAVSPDSSVMKALNRGDYQAAADAMLLYDKHVDRATKTVTTPPGLPPRRRSDRKLFMTGEYDSNH